MKTLKRVVAITILASVLYGCCYLIGATIINKKDNIKVYDYSERSVIAQEEIISEEIYENENIIYNSEEIIIEIESEKEEILEEEIAEAIEEEVEYIEVEYIDKDTSISNKYINIIDSLTEEEKDLICRITFREAGNQNQDGQRAVIEVILNRVIDERFPNTVNEVLSQPGQFSTWGGRSSVTDEQISGIYPLFDIIYTEESVLNGNYVYFDGKQHSYGKNYVKIQDHWFAE